MTLKSKDRTTKNVSLKSKDRATKNDSLKSKDRTTKMTLRNHANDLPNQKIGLQQLHPVTQQEGVQQMPT